MNSLYDYTAASELLELEATAQYDGSKQASYLCALTKEDGLHGSLQVCFNKERKQYQLFKEKPGDEPQEIVLRLTGILTNCELPPVSKVPNNPMRLRQAIQLTGLDTHKFKAALEGIATICSTFSTFMRGDQMQEWVPNTFRQWHAVGAANRYFSTGAIAASANIVPFNDLVDPDNILTSVNSNKYRHTVDNEVGYFQRETKEDGSFRYARTNPANISIGDIVEARISFLVAPVTSHNNAISKDFKLVMVLRSLAMINDTFRKKAALALIKASFQTTKGSTSLKRQADFSESEDEKQE